MRARAHSVRGAMDFLVDRQDLHRCRFEDAPLLALSDGQARLEVASFGLTSNNITYAMFGEAMSYWKFFPAPEGWGRVPMWGFANVVESRHEQLEVGRNTVIRAYETLTIEGLVESRAASGFFATPDVPSATVQPGHVPRKSSCRVSTGPAPSRGAARGQARTATVLRSWTAPLSL